MVATHSQVCRPSEAKVQRLQRWSRCASARGARFGRVVLSDNDSDSASNDTTSSRISKEASTGSKARLARWKHLTGPSERNAQRLSGRRAPPPIEGWVPASQSLLEEYGWQGFGKARELSVTTEVLTEGSYEKKLLIHGQLSVMLSSWPVDGGTESMAVISNERSWVPEVVFRRLTVETVDRSGERSRSVTESGSASATMELLARTAASFNTSTETLLRTLGGVRTAESVLQRSLPAGIISP